MARLRTLADLLALGLLLALADGLAHTPLAGLAAEPGPAGRALLWLTLAYTAGAALTAVVLRRSALVGPGVVGGFVLLQGAFWLFRARASAGAADSGEGGLALWAVGAVSLVLAAVAGAVAFAWVRSPLCRRLGRGVGVLGTLGLAALSLAPAPERPPPPDWPEAVARAPAATSPSLLLVTMDTVRPDHLEPYGYASIRTPHLMRLAQEGVLFRNAVAQAPITPPSHASLLTGLFPAHHGLRGFHSSLGSGPEVPALAEIVRNAGYVTGAVVAASPLDPSYGLQRGFDVYHYVEPSVDYVFLPVHGALLPIVLEVAGIVPNRNEYRPGVEITADALRFLDRYGDAPFFLWVHYFDAHLPYAADGAHRDAAFHPGKGLWNRFGRIFGYDSEIVGVDAGIGALLGWLGDRERLDETIVIATADHGEGLGQHGYQGHTHRIFEEQLRIPLLLRYPPAVPAGTRVDAQVRSVDVAPTALELMGIPATGTLDGQSLLGTLAGDAGHRLSFAELLFRTKRDASLASVSDGRFKLIRSFGGEHWLFDLEGDPGETENLADARPEQLARLGAALDGYLASAQEAPAGESEAMDPALRERLEALGYLK